MPRSPPEPTEDLDVTARQRRLLVGVGAIAACVLFLWNLGLSGRGPVQVSGDPSTLADDTGAAPLGASPAPGGALASPAEGTLTSPGGGTLTPVEGTLASPTDGGGRRGYALGLHELAGLPPDPSPGTRFDLWVTWDPPISEQPDLRRLIRDVVVAEVIPPLTSDGPTAIVVSVPTARIPDLIYADRYGALSVSLRDR